MDFFFGLRLTSKVIFSAPNDFLFENVSLVMIIDFGIDKEFL